MPLSASSNYNSVLNSLKKSIGSERSWMISYPNKIRRVWQVESAFKLSGVHGEEFKVREFL